MKKHGIFGNFGAQLGDIISESYREPEYPLGDFKLAVRSDEPFASTCKSIAKSQVHFSLRFFTNETFLFLRSIVFFC